MSTTRLRGLLSPGFQHQYPRTTRNLDHHNSNTRTITENRLSNIHRSNPPDPEPI